MTDTSLLFRSARELASLIRDGQVTSVQVVEAQLRQIRHWNPEFNAVVTLCDAEALRDAEAADKIRRSGKPMGPLHGVPMTLKDGMRVGGMRSTFGGLPPYFWHVPRTDCKLAARLRQAGAIFIGRTNLPLMALDWQCSNPFFKEGKNPWDLARTPGGSSGGAAAALAAGFTPLELGSDLGGSIRYPAHCCGVLGLRTTDGLLPIDDLGPEGMSAPFRRLLSFGPMARSIGDLALMLDVLIGSDGAVPDRPPAQLPLDRLKVAVTATLPGAEPNEATRTLLDGLCSSLRTDGHEVDLKATPDIDFEDAWRVWGTIAGYELWNSAPPLFRNRATRFLFEAYMLRYKLGDGPFKKWFTTGMTASPREYEDALAQREGILKSIDSFFQRYTLWIMPVCMGEAIRRQRHGSPIEVDGKQVPYSVYLGSYTVPTTAFGTPVLTIPIGFSKAGMPIGVQVHGSRFSDRQLLETAERFLSKYITVRVPPALTK